MMNVWVYLVLAAGANTLIQLFWTKKVNKKVVDWKSVLFIFIGSFMTAWGIDVLQRGLEVDKMYHIFKVALGCWLMVAVATAAKHYRINGWGLRQFKIDYGGDLIGFFLMGIIIYVLS